MKSLVLSAIIGALLAYPSIAHPGESAEQRARDIAERSAYLSTHKRSLDHCADKLKERGNDIAMQQRRSALVKELREKRAIEVSKPYLRARDLETVLNTSHKSNLTGITVDTDPSTIFTGNNSCVLSPESVLGPYWVAGELVRNDIVEDQVGVPLTLHVQIIDVNTCEPVPEVYLEMWHANSTGVYSGVISNGNGDSNDLSIINSTFLRGISQTDEIGVATIHSLFPGHYIGRATHIHVISHSLDTKLLPNNTLSGNVVTHVGQMYFDQDLIDLVETQEPYIDNTQPLTLNKDDFILANDAEVDPVIEYVLLGDDISEGVFGWLAFGFDSTYAFNATPAVHWTENGGVPNNNSGGGGPGGPPGGPGGPPGGPPSSTTTLNLAA